MKVRSGARAIAGIALISLFVGGAGCERSTRRPAAAGPAPGQWQGGYAPPPGSGVAPGPGPAPYPPAPYPPGPAPTAPGQAPPPGPAPTAPAQPPPPPPPPGPSAPVGNDPINAVDIPWLRNRAGVVLGELVAALPAAQKQRVQGVPLFADPTVGEVNAFAACDDQGMPLMAVSDGLLDVMAHLAQFKANDEVFGGTRTDAYIQLIARNQRPGQPIVRPAAGFVDPAQHADARKVARQNVLFDEELAFVLGHELAHHHLGHTGCANGGGSRGVSPADFGRLLSRAAPIFNQPNEVGSDVAGTNNLLSAGKIRSGAKWTEGGAMLVLNFFAGLDRLSATDILFGFERSHPPPLLRMPIVQQTAQTWRFTGGAQLPFPF